jgi:hypothetical protein
MATPQESITTVSGRRCTRSRARTAATSILTTTTQAPPDVTTTDIATSTAVVAPPPAQTSAVESPPASIPPAQAVAPPPSSVAAEPSAAAPSTQATVSTAIGTLTPAPIPDVPTTALASSAPSQVAAAGPKRPVENSRPAPVAAASVSQATEAATTTPVAVALASQAPQAATAAPASTQAPTAAPEPTSSDAISTALQPPASDPSSLPPPPIATSGVAESAVLQSSLAVGPESPSQVDTPAKPTPIAGQQTTAPASSLPSSDTAAGIIGPEQSSSESGGGLTLPTSGDANIGGIVGGVVGGVAGLALICALLFFCLRQRKVKQPRWSEKNVEGPRFLEKVKAIPASMGVIFAKVKGVKKGPYQQHRQQDSVSSIYSTTDSQGFYAPGDFMKRSSSRKSERNRLRKKSSSVSSQQQLYPGILVEADRNPFADPEPPRTLRLSNPDAASPRGPLTPQPAITSARPTNDPFASPFDGPDLLLPVQGHKRTESQASALSSHPPSFIFPSVPTAPSQPPQPSHNRRSSMALPTFDATSTAASGETDYGLYSENGPSRPGTGMFTPGLPTGRTVRQSDPFDLDRPEVLRFGNIMGRTEVRSSVTRQQSTRGKRTSSVGNWASVKDGYGPFSSWNSAPRR